jgi:kynureninase
VTHDLAALDHADTLAPLRDRFALPEGVIYLDGNSLGALPRATVGRVQAVVTEEWGTELIRSWNTRGWFEAPMRVGGKIARLIGAKPHEVIVADSTSINLYKAIVAALQLRPDRRTIVSEAGNFPTDLYMIESAIATMVRGHRLQLVDRDSIEGALDDDVALVLLTHVHYKTADVYDMRHVTAATHACGALTCWDLSHSVGAMPLALNDAGADFAVGCGYKFLNGGPGAPAFLYVADRLQRDARSPLGGWMGHAAPFAFDDRYVPGDGILRFSCGTPPVLSLAALEAGVDLHLDVDLAMVAAKSQQLARVMVDRVADQCATYGITPVGPPPGSPRGSHVSFRHPDAFAIMQALISHGVIGDFRAPDIMRFGLTPLYLRFADVGRAVDILTEVMRTESWRDPRFAVRAAVT